MILPFTLACEPPFLIVDLESSHQTLGWSVTKPGFALGRQIAWLEVRNSDLSTNIEPVAYLREKLSSRDLGEAIAFMTSRDIRRYRLEQSRAGRVTATCVATVGLSNGERVGKRRQGSIANLGTINLFIHVSRPLSVGAFVESISIAAQARTAAILETSHLRAGPLITGTGTDCTVIAAPQGDALEPYAGLHTDVGEAIGASVYGAVYEGAKAWSREVGKGQSI